MTVKILVVVLTFFVQQGDIPYLSKNDYSYEVDYFLKRKSVNSEQIYDASKRRTTPDMLPYVKIHFTFRKFEETDSRITVYHGKNRRSSKKIKGPMKITLDMGYAVDMKEGVTDAEFTIFIINENKDPRAQVLVRIEENGELLINEIPSGMI